MPKKTRNSRVLVDFVKYCEENPELRFWQALRNWSGYNGVLVTHGSIVDLEDTLEGRGPVVPPVVKDTFYWEEKDK